MCQSRIFPMSRVGSDKHNKISHLSFNVLYTIFASHSTLYLVPYTHTRYIKWIFRMLAWCKLKYPLKCLSAVPGAFCRRYFNNQWWWINCIAFAILCKFWLFLVHAKAFLIILANMLTIIMSPPFRGIHIDFVLSVRLSVPLVCHKSCVLNWTKTPGSISMILGGNTP